MSMSEKKLKIVKPALVTTSIKLKLVLCNVNLYFPSQCVSYQLNLYYVTIFHWSLGRSHKTGLATPDLYNDLRPCGMVTWGPLYFLYLPL